VRVEPVHSAPMSGMERALRRYIFSLVFYC
jgi:hypothetical protein